MYGIQRIVGIGYLRPGYLTVHDSPGTWGVMHSELSWPRGVMRSTSSTYMCITMMYIILNIITAHVLVVHMTTSWDSYLHKIKHSTLVLTLLLLMQYVGYNIHPTH